MAKLTAYIAMLVFCAMLTQSEGRTMACFCDIRDGHSAQSTRLIDLPDDTGNGFRRCRPTGWCRRAWCRWAVLGCKSKCRRRFHTALSNVDNLSSVCKGRGNVFPGILLVGYLKARKCGATHSFGLALKGVTHTPPNTLKCIIGALCGNHSVIDEVIRLCDHFTYRTQEYVIERGFRPYLVLDEGAMEEFEEVDTSQPNCVVVGLAPQRFNYETMNQAFRYLEQGAELIAIHKARYYRTEDGLSLGPGPFVAGLEYACGRNATVVGKPEAMFFRRVIENMEGDNGGPVFMIGDDVKGDIEGAQKIGCHGKYKEGDEHTITPSPFHVAVTFSDAFDYLIKYAQEP